MSSTGTMRKEIILLGTSLTLEVGQRVTLFRATNQSDPSLWFARPLNNKWKCGVEQSPDTSVLIAPDDVLFDVNLDVSLENVSQIWVESGGFLWVWNPDKTVESHDLMDRVGGPYHIVDFLDESDGERWFIFAVVDCHFPARDLVRADSFEGAYEEYVDWAAENRHIKIEEGDYADYKVESDESTCGWTSDGTPVDTESIQGHEVQLWKIAVGAEPKEPETAEEREQRMADQLKGAIKTHNEERRGG